MHHGSVRLITAPTPEDLEERVNEFLGTKLPENVAIVSLQYQLSDGPSGRTHAVLIHLKAISDADW
jgi:hypothetical protein